MKNSNQIQSVIEKQNPWWKNRSVPLHLAPPTERPLAKYLWKHLLNDNLKRYVVILGPRRVGKTTVMYQTLKHLLKHQIPPDKIQWVRLDHPLLIPLNLDHIVKSAIELSKATKEKPLYLFLDELVYAEKWDLWLKTFYDEHWPIHIIASSSATAALQKGRESGVGRWEEFNLTPYLLTELLQLYGKSYKIPIHRQHLHSTINDLYNTLPHSQLNFEKERKLLISYGGFPEILSGKKREDELIRKITTNLKNRSNTEQEISKDDQKTLIPQLQIELENSFFQKTKQLLRADTIERAIYKDIPQSYRIDSPMALEKLLYVLAAQVTGLLSLKNISEDIPQVSVQTLDRYLSYLIQTYLVFTLSNYDNNTRNIQRRQKKIYFVDVAIRNVALLKEREPIFNDPLELGQIQENFVASHLYHLSKQSNTKLYHWKRNKHEVDFIYDDPFHPMAFEVGSSRSHSRSGLKEFLKQNPKFKNGCYYVAPHLPFLSAEKSSSGIGNIPLDLLLLATGLQQDKALSVLLQDAGNET